MGQYAALYTNPIIIYHQNWYASCDVSLFSVAFLCYAASALAISLILMLHCAPRYGQTNIVVYVGICSVIGSLTVNNVHWYTFDTNLVSFYFIECFFPFLLLGNEHQGRRHCYQAYNWGYKPGWLFPNLAIRNCLSDMHNYSVNLPEQGTARINFQI